MYIDYAPSSKRVLAELLKIMKYLNLGARPSRVKEIQNIDIDALQVRQTFSDGLAWKHTDL